MAMRPIFSSEGWDPMRPSRIMNQHFGAGLDPTDLLTPLVHPFSSMSLRNSPIVYYRPWRPATWNDAGSTIATSKDKFQVTLDVQQFAPDEITVKVSGTNTIIVEGKHEEKPDEHGFISRQFARRYVLPDGYNINNVISNLSTDGVLSITAPRNDEPVEDHRIIPIQRTGAPLKTVEKAQENQTPKKDE